jgi:hypothetical protein
VPGEFVVRLGVGRDGSLHGQADGLVELGAAATMLMSWLEFVRIEVEGAEGCRDLVEGLLRGAVMAAGAADGPPSIRASLTDRGDVTVDVAVMSQ